MTNSTGTHHRLAHAPNSNIADSTCADTAPGDSGGLHGHKWLPTARDIRSQQQPLRAIQQSNRRRAGEPSGNLLTSIDGRGRARYATPTEHAGKHLQGTARPPISPLNPPVVAGAEAVTPGTGAPRASFVEFQSGTTPSGQRRAPMTGPFPSSTASYRSPPDQTSTGMSTSCVLLSLNSSRRRMGKGTEVYRRRAITA